MAKKKPQAMADMPLRLQQQEIGKQGLAAYTPLLQWAMQNAGMSMPQPQAPAPAPPPIASPPIGGRGGFQQQPARMNVQAPPMASIQPIGGGMPPAPSPLAQGPGVPNSALGVFGQGADALRFQQAEEDINDASRQRANLLRYRLGQQGIGNSGTMASALAQNERGAMDSLSDFRRNLAINAGGEQERRMQMIAQLLGLGQGIGTQGQQVSGMYKQMDQDGGLLSKLTPLASMFSFAPIKLR